MTKLNTYQLVCVHTNHNGTIRYDFISDFIVGHMPAYYRLADKHTELAAKGLQPSIIWRDLFFVGTDVYRLLKVDPTKPARHGLQGW